MSRSQSIALPAWVVVLLMLVGCATDRHRDIPADATMVSEGDRTLTYHFDQPGTVYVFNRDRDRMMYSGKVERGQTLHVEPDRNQIRLDDRVVRDENIKGNDTRRIFFAPDTRSTITTVEERRESR